MKDLFQKHLDSILPKIKTIMESNGVDRLIIESGNLSYQFQDDQPKNFKANPFFIYLCPEQTPGHVIDFSINDDKPTLHFYQPDDFWHEVASLDDVFWSSSLNVQTHKTPDSIWSSIGSLSSKTAVIAPQPEKAIGLGAGLVSDRMHAQLVWLRSQKTPYEVHCITEANRIASLGHKAAQVKFIENGTEFEIFNAYLSATQQREQDLPYGAIVGCGANAAILHYQQPKHLSADSMLIDAGARYMGYCSDITRTYAKDSAHSIFKYLVSQIDGYQQRLCKMPTANMSYIDFHRESCNELVKLLIETDILKSTADEAFAHDLWFPFYPHGLGHPLGLQVHDLGDKQIDENGTFAEQPKAFPYLRTLRNILSNDVLTVEPGLYFIPSLLAPFRNGEKREFFNWALIDELTPLGGIRIEDNIHVSNEGSHNLTRNFLL